MVRETYEVLLVASQALHSSLDLGHVCQVLVAEAGAALPARATACYVWDTTHQTFDLRAAIPEAAVPMGEQLISLHRDTLEQLVISSDSSLLAKLDDDSYAAALRDVEDAPVGVLVVWLRPDTPLGVRYYDIITGLATQAGLALQNALEFARTEITLHKRVIELSTIEVVSRQISATLDLTSITCDVLAAAISTVGADRGCCALVLDGQQLDVVTRVGADDMLLTAAHEAVFEQVLQSPRPAFLTDESAHAALRDLPPETRAVLAVPIMREERTIGILCLEDGRTRFFTDAHVQFVTMLAEHAAIAIDRARLYQQILTGRDPLQAILDSTREAVLLFDNQGRLLRFNPVAEQMVEHPLQLYVGQTMVQWMLDVGTARVWEVTGYTVAQMCAYVRAVQMYPSRITQRRFAQKHGEDERYIGEIGSPVLDQQGQLAGWLIVWRDHTEERQLEQMRQELSSMIVHDLRNPITSITSSLAMLHDLIEEGETDKAMLHEVVTIAQSSAGYMFNLVQSILDVARLEQNSIVLDCESHDLVDAINYAIQSVFSQALGANIELSAQVPDDLPPVWIDAEKIQRVLVNLLDNAVRHTPQHGLVQVRVYYDEAANVVVVCVSDSGPGIPSEARALIFDKFIQLDQQALRGHKGSGLGLTFCKLTVEAHRGRIWVDEADTGGASFCFTLPLAPSGLGPVDLSALP
ncbi:MAG: GAF domain-containing protein [Anaerolineae bacterium]|nr:GAF domain-containing protein [Anaerolineae bacterium]